jgi:multidrug resistance efflux pump
LLIRKRSALLHRQAAQEQLSDDLDLQYAQAARAEASAELEANRGVYNEASGAVPLSLLRKLRLAVERAELEVARAKKQRRLAHIDVELRAADLDLIENRMGRLEMTSPVTGVVLEAYVEPGEWVAAGDPVARVARLDRIHIHALCSIDRLPPARCRNQVVTVAWSTQDGRRVLRGRVTSVDPELLGDGRYRLHAEIENRREGQQWWLLPGTEVQMTVHPVQAVSPPADEVPALPDSTTPAAKQAPRTTAADRTNRLRNDGGITPR